jgi:hypothetical protein
MTEWCDIDRNNNGNRGPICCPNAGMYAADIVIFQQWNVQGSTRACDESSDSLSLPDCVDSSGNKYSG